MLSKIKKNDNYKDMMNVQTITKIVNVFALSQNMYLSKWNFLIGQEGSDI